MPPFSGRRPSRSSLHGLRALLTLGPTREPLDPVRFLSNASSGKMGLALARALRARGALPFLVSGPGVAGIEKFPHLSVTTARQMLSAVQKRFPRSRLFISTAAVADYRPAQSSTAKLPGGRRGLELRLLPNPDILATVTRRKRGQFCVGFALEGGRGGLARAKRKMAKKRCDLMVLNGLASMESDRTRAALIFADGSVQRLGKISKERCARQIVGAVAGRMAR